MNLLVVGGLLIVGVLALIATVFLLRSEPAKVRKPSQKAEQGEPATPTVASKPSLGGQMPPLPKEEVTADSSKQQADAWHPIGNGPLYDLANEVRTLHQQAQEFEYRLSVLRDMTEQMAYSQQTDLTTEEKTPSDISSVN